MIGLLWVRVIGSKARHAMPRLPSRRDRLVEGFRGLGMPVSGGVGERSAADGASVGVWVAGPKDRVPANTPLIISPHASLRERHHDFQLKSMPRNKTCRSRYVFTRAAWSSHGFSIKNRLTPQSIRSHAQEKPHHHRPRHGSATLTGITSRPGPRLPPPGPAGWAAKPVVALATAGGITSRRRDKHI